MSHSQWLLRRLLNVMDRLDSSPIPTAYKAQWRLRMDSLGETMCLASIDELHELISAVEMRGEKEGD